METQELLKRAGYGAIAGIVGTAAMTTTMRWLHRLLPPEQRYPLPPREIVEATVPEDSPPKPALTNAAHYGYGALSGALYALLRPAPSAAEGAAYGIAVWGASYLGWIPAARILTPATRHPPARDALMIVAHLVWGSATARTLRELHDAEREVFFDTARPAPDQEHG